MLPVAHSTMSTPLRNGSVIDDSSVICTVVKCCWSFVAISPQARCCVSSKLLLLLIINLQIQKKKQSWQPRALSLPSHFLCVVIVSGFGAVFLAWWIISSWLCILPFLNVLQNPIKFGHALFERAVEPVIHLQTSEGRKLGFYCAVAQPPFPQVQHKIA